MPAPSFRSVTATLAALFAAQTLCAFELPPGHPEIPSSKSFMSTEAPAMPAGHPPVTRPDSTLYELVAGGIAYHRKDVDFAASVLLSAAYREKNSEIAEMAWQAALATRDSNRLVAVARFWTELEPTSEMAWQTIFADAVEKGDRAALEKGLAALDKAKATRKNEKSATGDTVKPRSDDAWVGRVSRLFSRSRPSDARFFAESVKPYAQKRTDAESRLGYALLLKTAGEGDRACRLARAAQKSKPADASIVGEAADVCWSVDPEGTHRMLKTFLKRHPNEARIRLVLARVEARLGNKDLALRETDLAVKHAGDDASVFYNAGQIAADLSDAPRAEKHLLAYVEALRETNSEIDLSHHDVWLLLGNAALEQKALERAAKYWHELTDGPYAGQARVREAIATADLGRLDEACRILEEGRKTLPLDTAILYSAESKLLLENGRNREAYILLKEAVDQHPTDTEILYDAAMAAEAVGERSDSEAFLRQLLDMNPQHVQANNALGYLLAEENRDLAEARRHLDVAFKAAPLDPYILDSMGWLAYREGRFKAAYEFTNASLKKLYDAEVAAHLVNILCALNRREDAEKVLAEAIERSGLTSEFEALAARRALALPPAAEPSKTEKNTVERTEGARP